MSMFISGDQAQDFLTKPVSGVDGLGYDPNWWKEAWRKRGRGDIDRFRPRFPVEKNMNAYSGISALVYNEVQQRYEVPGVGAVDPPQYPDLPDAGADMAKGIARNVLQTYCTTGADINTVTDAEITLIAVDVVKGMTAAEILQIADTKSVPYQTYAQNLGKRVCNLATSRIGASKMPIPWGWIAFAGIAVIAGYFIFKK